MNLTYTMKRGDTLSLGGTVSGLPAGLVNARSMVRNPLTASSKVADLTVTLGAFVDTSTPRALLLEASSPTTTWPVGSLACDIEFQQPGGIVVSSKTFTLKVEADVTHD